MPKCSSTQVWVWVLVLVSEHVGKCAVVRMWGEVIEGMGVEVLYECRNV